MFSWFGEVIFLFWKEDKYKLILQEIDGDAFKLYISWGHELPNTI